MEKMNLRIRDVAGEFIFRGIPECAVRRAQKETNSYSHTKIANYLLKNKHVLEEEIKNAPRAKAGDSISALVDPEIIARIEDTGYPRHVLEKAAHLTGNYDDVRARKWLEENKTDEIFLEPMTLTTDFDYGINTIEELEVQLKDILKQSVQFERTFIMIKPDGVQRGLVGKIIQRFEDKGFKLVALQFVTPSKEQFETHYHDLKEKPFFPGLLSYMMMGPVCQMVWEGTNVVATGRKMLGATKPFDSLRPRHNTRRFCHLRRP